MEREATLLAAIDEALKDLTYVLVFLQETGEEGFVHDMTLAEAQERYPEWTFSHREVVEDQAFRKWDAAVEDLRFYEETKDMTEDELEEYLDCLSDYDYELDDCYDY